MEATSLPLFSSGASSPAVMCLSGEMRPPLWGHPLVRRLFGYLALAASSVTTVWPALAPASPAVTSLCPSSLDDALRGVTPTRWGVPCWALTLQAHTGAGLRPGRCSRPARPSQGGLLLPVSTSRELAPRRPVTDAALLVGEGAFPVLEHVQTVEASFASGGGDGMTKRKVKKKKRAECSVGSWTASRSSNGTGAKRRVKSRPSAGSPTPPRGAHLPPWMRVPRCPRCQQWRRRTRARGLQGLVLFLQRF